jgi:outer membrane protein insertion porin family
VDGGQVWGPDQQIDFSDMRYSAGIAFNWFSVLGPLSISYGIPLNSKDGDEEERLQITLGRFFR